MQRLNEYEGSDLGEEGKQRASGRRLVLRRECMNLKATGKGSTKKVKLDVQSLQLLGRVGCWWGRHPHTDFRIVFLIP